MSELRKLPNLKELRIDTNPFLDGETRATNRQMIIASLEKLEVGVNYEILCFRRKLVGYLGLLLKSIFFNP